MQMQTQTYAEKVRQEGKGHTRSIRVGILGPGQVSPAVDARTAQGTAAYWTQICDEVRFCRLDKTYKADIKRVTLGPTDSCGKSAASVPGRSSEDVKIIVKAFLAEQGVQANRKAWHNAMQSEHVKRMAIAQIMLKGEEQ